MSQPVWTLSVDLQTKTAVFQSGLADAAKSARGSFNDIKASAAEMGASTRYSMRESRESVMALGEMFGVHLPASITRTIAGLDSLGPALAAALPFAAIAVGAVLLIAHLSKLREEGEKLAASQANFGISAANGINALDQKLLEAGIHADELNNDHLGALDKQLQILNLTRLDNLQKAFTELVKESDAVLGNLESGWLVLGNKAGGYKESLERIKQQYESLLANKKDTEANDFLDSQLAREKKILELKEQANKSQHQNTVDPSVFAAMRELQQMGSGGNTDKDVEGQKQIVATLDQMIQRRTIYNQIATQETGNDKQEANNKIGADEDKLYRAQADAQRKAIDEQDKMDDTAYTEAVSRIQQAEQAKLEATAQGSAERLQAIDAAIKDENAHGLQETSMYKSLLKERIDVVKQMATEQGKIQEEAGKVAAERTLRSGTMQIAAEKESDALRMSGRHVSDQERISAEEKVANQEYIVQRAALSQQINALDQNGQEYENKLKALQNKQEELTKQHEDKITSIKTQAEIQRNQRILSAEDRMHSEIAAGLTKSITGQQSWGKMMNAVGAQVASGILENALKSILADDMTKPHDAAKAARKAFLAGEETIPGIPGVILGGALGAMAFASVMAFAGGGIVPGVGVGDVVPAMLTPGEAILPKALTEHLTNAAKFGKSESGGDVHVHVTHHSTIHALDSQGMEHVLSKHTDAIAKHVNNHMRRMNKR